MKTIARWEEGNEKRTIDGRFIVMLKSNANEYKHEEEHKHDHLSIRKASSFTGNKFPTSLIETVQEKDLWPITVH